LTPFRPCKSQEKTRAAVKEIPVKTGCRRSRVKTMIIRKNEKLTRGWTAEKALSTYFLSLISKISKDFRFSGASVKGEAAIPY
jgi:hypothetical protein